MNEKDFRQMMSVIKMHFQCGISQDAIAKKMFVSKSTVSRLIKKALEQGVVEYKIKDPSNTMLGLQKKVEDLYGVECIVLPTYFDDYLLRLNDVCAYAASELERYIFDDSILGVTWGRTTEYLAQNMVRPAVPRKNIKVCMMSGFVTGTVVSMKSTRIVEKLVEVFDAQGFVMPAPLLVDSKQIAATLYSDSNIKYVVDLCEKAQTIIVTIGGMDLMESYLSDKQTYNLSMYNKIAHSGGVGDIGGRNFDINGLEIKTNITDRIISLPLNVLQKKKNKICIAVGTQKAKAILGALRGGLISRLYTDEATIIEVLKEHKIKKCNVSRFV